MAEQIGLTARLRPAASPVDTYVKPAQSPLMDLAESLSKISPELQAFISQKQRKQAENDLLRGQAAGLTGKDEGLAEAVRTGRIPAQYSPTFVKGYKRSQGVVSGGKLREAWNIAYDAWAGKNSEDPAAFDTFLEDFLKSNIGTQDPEILAGLLPSVLEIQANGRARHIEYRHKQTYEGAITAGTASVVQGVQEEADIGLSSPTGTNYEKVWQNIFKEREAKIAIGISPEEFDRSVLEAMSAKIIELKDPGMMAFFDQKVPGKDYTYGETPDGLKIKNATMNALEVAAREQVTSAARAEKRKQDQLKDSAQTGIIQSLIADPNSPVPENLLQQAEKNGDPTIRTKLREWRTSLSAGGVSDPQQVLEVTRDIMDGGGMSAVRKAMERGVYKNAADLEGAIKFAQSFDGVADTVQSALGSQVSRDILNNLRIRTISKDDVGNPIQGISQEGYEAQFDFRRMMTQWVIDNPEAKPWEIEEQASKFGKLIEDRLKLPEGGDPMFDATTYDRNPDLGFGNPYTNGQPAPAAQDVQVPGEPQIGGPEQPQAPAGKFTPEDAQGLYDGMTPEQKATIDGIAKQNGVSPTEQLQKLMEQQPDAAIKASPISYNPDDPALGDNETTTVGMSQDQAMEIIDNAMAMDDGLEGGAQSLLSFIVSHEAKGNWNAVYGNANSSVDLSQYTLDEVLGLQQRMLKLGYASTAIGGPQFLHKTLKGLKAEMGLTGNEKFTPELQMQLGMGLLNRRGYQDFKAGRISKRRFARNLSQEWAALPDPRTGRSFYAGDGLNRSLTPVSEVYRQLGFVTKT